MKSFPIDIITFGISKKTKKALNILAACTRGTSGIAHPHAPKGTPAWALQTEHIPALALGLLLQR